MSRPQRLFILALLISFTLPARVAAQLPRATIDRPDDVAGYQIKVLYVLPSDGPDRALDTNGTLTTSVAAWQQWLAGQAGRGLRLDRFQGQLDIRFIRLRRTDAELRSYGAFVRDEIEYELAGAGLLAPHKIYAVYYDGGSDFACGGAPWPPLQVGQVAALYLRGTPPGAPACDTNAFAANAVSPGYFEFAMLHEVFHALGMVPVGAPNRTPNRGHVSDHQGDIMYSGPLPWQPVLLDINRDDYYQHGDATRLDLDASVFFDPAVAGAAPPPRWPVTDVRPSSCSQEQALRSTPTGTRVTLINSSGAVRRLWGLDAAGQRRSAWTIEPWGAITISPPEWSVATDAAGVCTGIYRTPADILNPVRFILPADSLDSDADGLPDSWEERFGLDAHSAAGADGALGDPDGDARANLHELQQGTHPRGTLTRYFAEGATGTFFDTRIALFNPGPTATHVLLRFLKDDGTEASHDVHVPGKTRQTVIVEDVAGMQSASFSTTIEADTLVIADRVMSWDTVGYGSHADGSLAGASTSWYLAEGSTSGDFSLFYLLQNPHAAPVTATVKYLLSFGAPPVEIAYTLPPRSRTTIPVDLQAPALAHTDVSAALTSSAPIIAERSMYRSTPAQIFAAGHESAGVTAPATRWFLAEGATGPFFDLFILLANPSETDAQVRVDYLLSTGETFTKSYTVPANGRVTIFVDEERVPEGTDRRPLNNVAVSSLITSVNDVPIIVERTMWWPSPDWTPAFWTEAHNAPGATETGTLWAIAEGEVGGAQGADTYILVANTSPFAGRVKVALSFEDGTGAERIIDLLPTSRTNVNVALDFPTSIGRRFGATIESLDPTPAQIVVERAIYTSPQGQLWAAGSNALATRLR